jgi:predicted dehydrogenase
MKRIGVGIIGASPNKGWARDAHIPALAASPDFELVAVATSNPESAKAAAEKFGVSSYSSAEQMIADPSVELIVVSVRIPLHKPLVEAAIASGKPILCEWSLGAGLGETLDLATQAEHAGVRGFVELQARASPGYNHVKALLNEGYIGEVLSSSIIASGVNWGPIIDPANTYILNSANQAGMLVIPFGHTMDGVCYCLGEAEYLSAELANRRQAAVETGTGRSVPMTVPDQVAVTMKLESGAILSAHFRGGLSSGTNFHWEINGTEGDIVVTAPHGLTELCELQISAAKAGQELTKMATPADCMWAPSGSGLPGDITYNIAQNYALLAQDLADGGSRVPTFADALRRTRMIDAIEQSAVAGERRSY